MLLKVLNATMRLLHPQMPLLTEELWAFLPGADGPLMKAPWPNADDFPRDEAAEQDFERMRDRGVFGLHHPRWGVGFEGCHQYPDSCFLKKET